jgi:uncharacterized membrane protein YphA (DoxX/SURF4 family)
MTPTSWKSVWKLAGLWLLTVLLAAFFLMAGGAKLVGSPSQIAHFVRWGYPGWFLYVVGIVESVGAIGLVVPRLAGFAVFILGIAMIGAPPRADRGRSLGPRPCLLDPPSRIARAS